MKKIINKKMYNTETSICLHSWDDGCYGNDFRACEESLYKTKRGAYFIAGSGGPMSKYAKSYGSNSTGGSSDITPVSKAEAIEWLESHDGTNAIEQYFADDIEEA
ncbi:MAG TPA: hypothetical protein ENG95_05910 [Nitrospirae bacterium]|nr:hypothetical protein [Nitrospirota bacterium]